MLANDFGERITPVLVAYRDKEKVQCVNGVAGMHKDWLKQGFVRNHFSPDTAV